MWYDRWNGFHAGIWHSDEHSRDRPEWSRELPSETAFGFVANPEVNARYIKWQPKTIVWHTKISFKVGKWLSKPQFIQ